MKAAGALLLLGSAACAAPAPSVVSTAPPTSAFAPTPQPSGSIPVSASSAAAPGAAVPAAFVGRWTGEVEQIGDAQSPYPVTIQIDDGRLGDTIGSADYAKLNCQTHWVLRKADAAAMTVREIVDRGNCVTVDVSLTLLPDGRVAYAFDAPAHGRSTLTKVA